MREKNSVTEEAVLGTFALIQEKFSSDWLLALELYELAAEKEYEIQHEIKTYLDELKVDEEYTSLIDDGLSIIHKEQVV